MSDPNGTDEIAARAEAVLRQAGVPAPYRLEPITDGGNNRVFRVASAGEPVVLKVYFRHPDDLRDRLRADFGFSSFTWAVGVQAVPRPLASDHETGMAVYEFVVGRKLAAGEVTASHVAEAVAFFRSVNEHRADPRAADLPEAAEACFSIAAHVACIDRRVERLVGIDVESPLGREAAELVSNRLRPAWGSVRANVLAAAGSAAGEPLRLADRCLSPSDFGFHNAILAADGRLRFIDFEYAGWDDPAKTVCDFFCQPAVPVPSEHFERFLAALVAATGDAGLRDRVALLFPVYELKWCCIMLNEFLPVEHRRRSFASGSDDAEARRARQLNKVDRFLDRLLMPSTTAQATPQNLPP